MNKTITGNIKKLTCLIAGSMLALNVQAQTTGGPDTYGYIWRDSNDPNGPAFNWVDIANAPGAVQVTGLADDNIRGPFTIGFPFHYYWYDLTTFRVGSNGYIGFSTTPVAHPFPIIPTPTGIQNYMGIMTSDLTFTDATGGAISGAECWYWTNPANDTLIVSYIEVPFWDPVAPNYIGSNSFQVILSNVDSSITYQYLTQNGVYNNPTDFCTIGIENNSGNIGLMHTHDILPPSIYAIKYYPPAATSFQVNDASTVYNNNEETGGLFLSKDGAPFVMNTQIRNTGNQTLAPFNVLGRVLNSTNQVQATSTVVSGSLVPGAVEDIIFPVQFTPTTAGTFRFVNDTQLPGDATPSNNQKTMEIQVLDTTVASIKLSFDNGTDAGLGGLGWQGGGGGAGIQFIPPFYPCNITQVSAFIAANANLAGFALMILDDDGPGGTPLTVLDSIWVDPAAVLVGAWNTVAVTNTLTINAGSFYVAWMMGADGISVGQNQLAPISNRTYEILGQASNPNAWAAYRYREIEDVMINVFIANTTIGIDENSTASFFGNFYPNPAADFVNIDYYLSENTTAISWSVTDLNGKLILNGEKDNMDAKGTIQLNVSDLSGGLYICSLKSGSSVLNKKLTILK
ncbi:MAG: T9SS type A sorting domain-containing protein [Bacteroidetes bacterium]|nr:T9SS type A sorting domain-containing protein [Bacteroidota bacterium]